MGTITNRDKAECAFREVQQRRRVYCRLVADGKMSQAFADRQVAIMEAISADYHALADADEAQGRLL